MHKLFLNAIQNNNSNKNLINKESEWKNENIFDGTYFKIWNALRTENRRAKVDDP